MSEYSQKHFIIMYVGVEEMAGNEKKRGEKKRYDGKMKIFESMIFPSQQA